MPTCKTATPPPHHFEDRQLKSQHNVPNNLPQEIDGGFFDIFPVR